MNSEKSTLTPKQWKAAQLVAEANLKHVEIAEEVGCVSRTLTTWKKLPAFIAKVAEIRVAAAQKAGGDDAAIDTVADRMARRRSNIKRFDRIIEQRERAAAKLDPNGEMGLNSGFILLKRRRKIQDGTKWEVLEERFDGALTASYDRVMKEAAEDLGQRVVRAEHSGPNGGPIQVQATVTVGYHVGFMVDAARFLDEVKAAGRMPEKPEDFPQLLAEMEDRHKAALQGIPVPDWSIPFDLESAKRAQEEGG